MFLPQPVAVSMVSRVVCPVHTEECVALRRTHDAAGVAWCCRRMHGACLVQSCTDITSLSSQQSNSTVRAYPTSKSRVTMSPGFSSQWSSSQPAWNTYSFPRASLHYQSHASYTCCTGHPVVSTPSPGTPSTPGTLGIPTHFVAVV